MQSISYAMPEFATLLLLFMQTYYFPYAEFVLSQLRASSEQNWNGVFEIRPIERHVKLE